MKSAEKKRLSKRYECTSKHHLVEECVFYLSVSYKNVLKDDYDAMCPTIEKLIKVVDRAPWLSTEIREDRMKCGLEGHRCMVEEKGSRVAC